MDKEADRLKAEGDAVMLLQLIARGYGDAERDSVEVGLGALVNILKVVVGEQEFGYRPKRFTDGAELDTTATSRGPSDWLSDMGQVYVRRAAVPAGEWEPWNGEVQLALDPRPWLPAELVGRRETDVWRHYTAHNTGESVFAPSKGYEQDIARYNFSYAACGRTDAHFAHSNRARGVLYCNGAVR